MVLIDRNRRKNGITALDKILLNGEPIWKPGKATSHLDKRKRRDHVPADFNLTGYNNLIMNILREDENDLSLHVLAYFDQDYFVIGDGKWIVMYGANAVMETAYPPDHYDVHFNNQKDGFFYLGTVAEVRRE